MTLYIYSNTVLPCIDIIFIDPGEDLFSMVNNFHNQVL